MPSSLSIKAHFRKLRDPRRRHCREHRFLDIIVIAICAVISNADSYRTLAATIEPAGGSAQPTGAEVVSGSVMS